MNMVKTFILLAGLTALFGGAGFFLGGHNGMLIALGVGMAMNVFAYWNSDKMILKMYNAKSVNSGWLYDTTKELAQRANLPMPKVYIMETSQPNAFATGRSPKYGAVAVTRGIMNILDERELRGVIAHELAHIQNRDTLIMTVTATIAGALSTLANFAMFFGGGRDRPGGPIGTLVLMILAPLAAMLVQMAISRVREYAADKRGGEICDDPLALASALQKLERAAQAKPNWLAEQNPGTAHLFIVNPLHMRKMDNLFATHPNTKNRIEALQKLANMMRDPSYNSRRAA